MKKILLIGGGGHCKSCIDVIQTTEAYDILGILDLPEKVGTKTLGVPIVGVDEELPYWLERVDDVLITVGQIRSHKKRASIAKIAAQLGANMATIISPLAYVAGDASVSAGTIVMHGAKLIAGSKVGANCIINSNALIEHDATIGQLCHISTAAVVNGDAIVEAGSFVGSGAIIFQGVSVGRGSVVGGGEIIRKDLAPGYHPGNRGN